MLPVLEDHVGRDGPQMLKETVFGSTRDDGGSPGKNGKISGSVEGKGQQIEGDEDIGEGLLAVPEAVLEVVSAGLEDVEGLVLYLPARPAAGGQIGHDAGADREIRDEAVVVGPLSLVVEDLDGEPVDRYGVLGGAQRHCDEPAVDGGGALAALVNGLTILMQFGAMEIFGDGLMGGGLAGQDEAAAGVLDGGNDGLAGKQVVTEIDWPKMVDRGAVPGQPVACPCEGRGFAALRSQSCFSAPSRGTMNSGGRGRTCW